MFNDTVAQTELIGPPNPIVRRELQTIRAKGQSVTDADRARIAELEAKEDVRVPFTIRWNRSGREGPERGATIEIAGQSIRLKQGEWSRWINLDFRVNLFVRLHGMAQMYLMAAGPELQLYISPVNWKPDAPPLPISSPASFSEQLYERIGPYRTLGWAEATWPLNEGRMDEATSWRTSTARSKTARR